MKAAQTQADLFATPPAMPEGFRYQPNLIGQGDHDDLAALLATMPFKPFDFGGRLANRQVVTFGFGYDYGAHRLREAPPIPEALLPLRAKVAAFAGRPAEAFVQCLINEYREGAGVGWHRDRPHFGDVVGVSLLSASPFRFRLKQGDTWLRRTLTVEPRSAYLISGPARSEWDHSVPPVEAHRYSITFRTMARG